MLSLWIGDSQLSQFQHQSRKAQNGDDDDDGNDEMAVEEHDEFADHALENEVYYGFYVDLVAQAMVNTN